MDSTPTYSAIAFRAAFGIWNRKLLWLLWIIYLHWWYILCLFSDWKYTFNLLTTTFSTVVFFCFFISLKCEGSFFLRVSLDPKSQELVGVLRNHVIQFNPLYKAGSLPDPNTPDILKSPLTQWVNFIHIYAFHHHGAGDGSKSRSFLPISISFFLLCLRATAAL